MIYGIGDDQVLILERGSCHTPIRSPAAFGHLEEEK